MSIALSVFIKALIVVPVTLLPILNPIAVAPIFLSMTGPMDQGDGESARQAHCLQLLFLANGAVLSALMCWISLAFHFTDCAGSWWNCRWHGWLEVTNDQGQDKLRTSVAESASNWTKEELRRHSFYPFSFPLTVGLRSHRHLHYPRCTITSQAC